MGSQLRESMVIAVRNVICLDSSIAGAMSQAGSITEIMAKSNKVAIILPWVISFFETG